MKKFFLLGFILGNIALAQENFLEESSPSSIVSEAPTRRWGITPFMGLATIVTRVSGYENMQPGFSLGLRPSFDFSKYFALGLQVNADLLQYSYDEEHGQGKLEVSNVNYLILAEARIPTLGLYFGPVVGFSRKSFQQNEETHFFSTSKVSIIENLLVYGAYVGWNFIPGNAKRVVMGPRADFYHYSATHTDYISSHSALNVYFTTKFLF